MEWFKHDTDASTDAKIRKLVMHHGAVGYAVYFHCLELIMADVNKNNITFQLEHDAEIIADNLKITGSGTEAGVDIVNRIMRTIVDLRLFEENSNRITCLKLAFRLDSSMTSNSTFRKQIQAVKQQCTALLEHSHDTVMIPSCRSHDTVMQEEEREIRIEEEYKEKNIKKDVPVFEPYKPKITNKFPDFSFIEDEEMKSIFMEWSKNKKGKYTKQLGLEKGYSHLVNLSGGDLKKARAIVDQSLAGNYAGLFELKKSSPSPSEFNTRNMKGVPGWDANYEELNGKPKITGYIDEDGEYHDAE